MLKFCCFITGDDYQMVKKETPASKKKIASLVSALFIPVTMWIINIILVVLLILEGSLIAAIISGLVAGMLIFSIERNIIMSNGSKAIMAFRIFLGLIIALLGSIAFDEIIFKNDIDQKLAAINIEQVNASKEEVRNRYKLLIDEQEKIKANRYSIWQESEREAAGEAEGETGSKTRGYGPITKLKKENADNNREEYHNAEKALQQLKQDRNTAVTDAGAQVESSLNENVMLLRIKALFKLVLEDPWMLAVYCLVTLFLFFLEFIVVLLKIYLPKTNLEKKVQLIERIGQKRIERMYKYDEQYFDLGRIHSMKQRGGIPQSTSNDFSIFKHN